LKALSIGLGAATIALVGVTPSHASELYGAVRAGQSTNTSVSGIDLNDGFAYGGAVGGAIGPVRAEVAADHLSGDFAGFVDGSAWDISASAILDFQLSHDTALFAGAGLDYVKAEAKVPFGSMSAEGQGYSYQAGMSHRFANGVMGEVRYKHTEVNDLDGLDLSTDQVTAGVRFTL
jgi:opacity protein-like surface antigen